MNHHSIHDIVLTLLVLLAFYRELPRFWAFLMSLFPGKRKGGKGGDVNIQPGLGSEGFPNGKLYLKNSRGENVIVIADDGLWVNAGGGNYPNDPAPGPGIKILGGGAR